MGCPQKAKTVLPDEETLRAWEEMRIELLHELQEGAGTDVPDEVIDATGQLLAMLKTSPSKKRALTRLPVSA